MKRYGIERAGCQSLVRDVTPDGLVVVFCDLLWMEALARAAFARVTCANSLFFIWRQAICIEIVLFGRMARHGRHVEILYMPKFSVYGQNSAVRRVPEHTIR